MKKIIGLLTIVVFLLGLTSLATATTYTIPIGDLDNAHFIDQDWKINASETGRSDTAAPGWERYYVTSSGYEAKVGIGDSFDYNDSGYSDNAGFGISSMPIGAGGMGDLTGFDYYALMFHNPNNTPIHVNLFMNTGWTDNNLEPNKFWQNGWTWLDPYASATLSIDLAGVLYLNHVSNIGFQAVFHDEYGNWGEGTGDNFGVDVAPVPEPATMLLLGSGLIGLGFLGRKKLFKRG